MENLESKTVADIVSANIKTADVFKKYGIDFCCGGGITLDKACEKHKVDRDVLIKEIHAAEKKSGRDHDYKSWSPGFLADYILNTHHTYVREALGLLDQYMAKVVKVHGGHHAPLLEIQELYAAIASELKQHMMKEEQILFPYIKKLEDAITGGGLPPGSHFGTVRNPIQVMNQEHENAGDLMSRIRVLTNNYTPPEWSCNTFKALYAKLLEFEQDLHLHVHLENNILFPKAIELEQRFNKGIAS